MDSLPADFASDPVVLPLRSDEDVMRVRMLVRDRLVAAGFNLIDQTKFITATSELARNAVTYGGGGEARVTSVLKGSRRGLRVSFIDHGPGIADIALAMTNGYTSGSGLGLGLSGAKRLSDEFEITSAPGRGTVVVITQWKRF